MNKHEILRDVGTKSKLESLRDLGTKRKVAVPATLGSNDWPNCKSVADYHSGAYDCDYVSPYTKSASNADSSVFVVLQDWSSHNWLIGPLDHVVQRLGYSPSLPTNINLKQLLKSHLGVELIEVFATNLFPFVKSGNLNANIPANLMLKAATEFCIPQIEIVKPKIVVCMGTTAFNAIRQSKGLKKVKNLQDGFEQPFMDNGTEYWCQSHPGKLGRINRQSAGRLGQVDMDWAVMARRLSQL